MQRGRRRFRASAPCRGLAPLGDLEVLNQLASQTVVVNMPVSQLLICHAPVVIVSADILKGKKLTGYWNIQVDLKNAGGSVSDEPVVTDGNLITSRHPIDVADFSRAVEKWLVQR